MFLVFKQLLILLALLDKEEVLFLEGCKDLKELVWCLEVQLIPIVGVLYHFS
jgi:hypothetical protein